ncbi:hypothetical protein ACFXO2_35765, partial [Streptomyces sp. NPDC059152]
MAGLFVLVFLAIAVRGASRSSGGCGGGATVNIRKAVFRRNRFHGLAGLPASPRPPLGRRGRGR